MKTKTGQQYGVRLPARNRIRTDSSPLNQSATMLIFTNQTGQKVGIHLFLEKYVR
jgi:hypothetical protein